MKTLQAIALLAVVYASPLWSQSADGADSGPDLYQIEVLVFRHLDQSRTTSEIPRLVEPQIADVLDQQLPRLTASPAPAATNLPEGTGPLLRSLWQPVTGERFMTDDAGRLARLDAYGLIGHLAWIQAAPDVAVAEEITAAELGAPSELSGHLKLYRKRYLHLAVDLALEDQSEAPGMLFRSAAESSPAIVDSRRMRLGRTVYFDQPSFGVLATVNKLESDPET